MNTIKIKIIPSCIYYFNALGSLEIVFCYFMDPLSPSPSVTRSTHFFIIVYFFLLVSLSSFFLFLLSTCRKDCDWVYVVADWS